MSNENVLLINIKQHSGLSTEFARLFYTQHFNIHVYVIKLHSQTHRAPKWF